MPPFAERIQKANWPLIRVLFRGEPPKEPSPRMTTAAIRMRAGELFLVQPEASSLERSQRVRYELASDKLYEIQ